jgi:hypothetical protein
LGLTPPGVARRGRRPCHPEEMLKHDNLKCIQFFFRNNKISAYCGDLVIDNQNPRNNLVNKLISGIDEIKMKFRS